MNASSTQQLAAQALDAVLPALVAVLGAALAVLGAVLEALVVVLVPLLAGHPLPVALPVAGVEVIVAAGNALCLLVVAPVTHKGRLNVVCALSSRCSEPMLTYAEASLQVINTA
jgi:hypothetical protein